MTDDRTGMGSEFENEQSQGGTDQGSGGTEQPGGTDYGREYGGGTSTDYGTGTGGLGEQGGTGDLGEQGGTGDLGGERGQQGGWQQDRQGEEDGNL